MFNINKFLRIILLLTIPYLSSCANLNNDQDGLEYYTPDLDIYVFRDNSDPGLVPWKTGFRPQGIPNIVDYVLGFFDRSDTSIHSFQIQNDMVFYASKIRLFLVTPLRGIKATYIAFFRVDSNNKIICNGGELSRAISIEDVGISSEDLTRCPNSNERRCYYGDLITAGYNVTGLPAKRLYLTNHEGTETNGREVRVDRNRIRMFFSNIVSPCPNIAGVVSLIPRGRADLTINKILYSFAISSFVNGRSFGQSSLDKNLKATISHEMGHYFGLHHPFERTNNENLSCQYANEGTTNRVMDYYSRDNRIPPETFIPCEQDIYKRFSDYFLNSQKVRYEFDENDILIGPSRPNPDISTTLYNSLSTSRQMMVEEGRLEIIDSSLNYISPEIQEEPVSADLIKTIKPVE